MQFTVYTTQKTRTETKMENLTKKLSLVKNQKGFSLIEWIITGAICSTLTVIAVHNYRAYKKENNERKARIESQARATPLIGKISGIEDKSFLIYDLYGCGEFQFENLRIKDNYGRDYSIIYPGPSGYKVGEDVSIRYTPLSTPIIYKELFAEYFSGGNAVWTNVQKGYFKADGIIEVEQADKPNNPPKTFKDRY